MVNWGRLERVPSPFLPNGQAKMKLDLCSSMADVVALGGYQYLNMILSFP